MKQLVIVVDFDLTCADYGWPLVEGSFEVPHAARVIKRLTDKGHKIILSTMRSDKGVRVGMFPTGLTDAVSFFLKSMVSLSMGYKPTPNKRRGLILLNATGICSSTTVGWAVRPRLHTIMQITLGE